MAEKIFHYLLVYDREADKLIGIDTFTPENGELAVKEYGRREKILSDERYEVVLLGADSINTLMVTHGAYFGTVDPHGFFEEITGAETSE